MNIMNDAAFNQLLDTALRRKLTPEEEARLQAYVAQNPQARAIWEEEMALSQLLNGLPDAPLASNFTARVLQAVERDSRQRHAPKHWRWFGLRRPAQQCAAACLAVVLAALVYWQYESVRRQKMALALHRLTPHLDSASTALALTPDELWKNFDAINRLPQTETDEELLAVLKEVAMK